MKLQLIHPSKLKIIFDLQDLKENEISLHSFLSGSKKSKTFLKAILEIANEDFGINFLKQELYYETFCFNYSEFIILISAKCTTEELHNDTLSFNFIDDKLSNYNLHCENLIYFFPSFENFLDFSNYLKMTLPKLKIYSTLFEYNQIFLLEIDISLLSTYEYNFLLAILSETTKPYCINKKDYSYISKLAIAHFKEFGNKLITNNALDL